MIDLTEGVVHVFTGPAREGYAEARRAVAGDTITAAALDGPTVPVVDILGAS